MGLNIFQTGMDAFGAAYDQQNKMRSDRAKLQAGRAIAGGDYTGGAAALNSAGMIDEGHNVIADQQQLQDRQANSAAADAQRKATALINVAQGLKMVPVGQRQAALQSKLPIFQAMKIDTTPFQSLDEAHLTDDQLDQFSATLGKVPDEYTLGADQTRYRGDKPIASGAPKHDWKEVTNPDGSTSFIDLASATGPQGGSAAPPAPSAPQATPTGNQPRGLRNNNPLNVTALPHGQWDGQTGTDGKYAVFQTPEQGMVAADKNLQAYGAHHGINTIAGVIQRWAPASENDTAAYISTVSKAVGVAPNAPVNLADPSVRQSLLGAMARVELGKPLPAMGGQPQAVPTPTNTPLRIPGSAPGTKTMADQGGGLTDDAVELLAGRYLKDGTLPPLGMGKAAAEARQKILNAATRKAKELGVDAGDLVAGTLDIKAAGAALNKITTNLALVKSFENTAIQNADLALSLAPKGAAPLNVPILNRWVQTGRKAVQGDPSVTQFDVALGTFLDEYAKIVSGATGGQGSTDASRKEAYERLSKYATQGQIAAGIATMKQEMHNRTSSMEDVQEGLRSHIRGGPTSPPPGPAPAPNTGARRPLSDFIRSR